MGAYLHIPHQSVIDCCYTSNFDEEYAKIYPRLSPSQNVNLVAHYPDYTYQSVFRAIKHHYGVASVALGSGSEELILRVNEVLSKWGSKIGIVVPIFYRVQETCRTSRKTNLKAEDFFSANLQKFDAVWLQNPNLFNRDIYAAGDLLTVIRKNASVLFLVDEAAIFTVDTWRKYSLLSHTRTQRNIVTFHSFSKLHGLSGMRAGFAVGNPSMITALNKLQTTFPYTTITANYVLAALSDSAEQFLDKVRIRINHHKMELNRLLKRYEDILVYNSTFNCLFLESRSKSDLFTRLRHAGILTLNLTDGKHTGSSVRMTVHSSKQIQKQICQRLKKAFARSL